MPRRKPKELEEHDFKCIGDERMADRPVQVRVPVAIREKIDQLPPSERPHLLRQWIEEGLKQWNADLTPRDGGNN